MRLVVLAAALCVCAGPTRADNADVKKNARTHFRAGTAFFEGGAYDQAIAEYETAYKLLPLPDLLFNLAQAHRLTGDDKTAIDYYRRYLEAKPTGTVADEAREHLAELTAKPYAPPSAATTSEPAAPSPPPPIAPPAAAPPSTKTTLAAPAPQRRSTPTWKRPWVWAVVGGVVAVGVGVGLGVGLGLPPRTPHADGSVSF